MGTPFSGVGGSPPSVLMTRSPFRWKPPAVSLIVRAEESPESVLAGDSSVAAKQLGPGLSSLNTRFDWSTSLEPSLGRDGCEIKACGQLVDFGLLDEMPPSPP